MANMQAVCEKYVPSVKAYLLIPIVGSLFADFINSLVYAVDQFPVKQGGERMFWKKRKENAAKYKVENENLAVPEIHLKGDDDADPAEVCGEDQDIVYENVAVPEIHIGKKTSEP